MDILISDLLKNVPFTFDGTFKFSLKTDVPELHIYQYLYHAQFFNLQDFSWDMFFILTLYECLYYLIHGLPVEMVTRVALWGLKIQEARI